MLSSLSISACFSFSYLSRVHFWSLMHQRRKPDPLVRVQLLPPLSGPPVPQRARSSASSALALEPPPFMRAPNPVPVVARDRSARETPWTRLSSTVVCNTGRPAHHAASALYRPPSVLGRGAVILPPPRIGLGSPSPRMIAPAHAPGFVESLTLQSIPLSSVSVCIENVPSSSVSTVPPREAPSLQIIQIPTVIPNSLTHTPAACPLCSSKFASPQPLITHIRWAHHIGAVEISVCDHCNKPHANEPDARVCVASHLSSALASSSVPPLAPLSPRKTMRSTGLRNSASRLPV